MSYELFIIIFNRINLLYLISKHSTEECFEVDLTLTYNGY